MNKKPAAINIIWLLLILLSVVIAAYTGSMDETTRASFDSAKSAVSLAINLIGIMALWLGIMKVAEKAGLMRIIARAIKPVMIRLFPDVPAEHPAMSAMLMNFAANMLGLGNAATPLGIKAMQELDSLNEDKGTATNAMCLFLAINTSAIALLPLGVISIRAAAGASNPASIFIPSLCATAISTTVAIIMAKTLAKSRTDTPAAQPGDTPPSSEQQGSAEIFADTDTTDRSAYGTVSTILVWGCILAFLGAIPYRIITAGGGIAFSTDLLSAATAWLLPLVMCFFLLFGFFRGVSVYEALTEGAKEGFSVAVRIIPYFVAIFVAIGMFRASGAFDLFTRLLDPLLSLIGMPADAVPMALMRPLSGSGAFGIMSEVVNNAPDSFSSFLVSIMQGSTETTFYVLAVYFGSVSIRRTRHALGAALTADAAGIIASLVLAHLMFS